MNAIFVLAILLSGSATPDDGAQVAPPAANEPIRIEEPAALAEEPADDASADVAALLDKLEVAAAELRDFSASLRYDKWDPITNRWEIRAGDLAYEVKPDRTKRFAMHFETLIIGERKQVRPRHYVYDNGWLAEIDDDKKQFIKRQIVPPGKEFDPFRLGEGPFPLPIGQARQDVLARFDVTLLAQPEASQLADLENVDGMRLIPKAGTKEAESFKRVDIFYDQATLLPVGIEVIELGGTVGEEKKVVRLRNLKRNEGVDAARLSVEEPSADDGWAVVIEPWRENP